MIFDRVTSALLRERLVDYGPWLTFAVTLLLTAWLASSSFGPIGVIGFAEGEPLSIAPTLPARVLTVAVEPGQEVAAGQFLATVDTGDIDAELAIAEAERAALDEQLTAEAAGVARDARSERGDLDVAVERSQVALAEEEEAYRSADAERLTLDAERRRIQSLLREGLATREDLARIELAHSTATQRANAKPEVLRVLREQLHNALARRDQVAAGEAVATTPLRRQIDVVERQIEALERRRAEATLRAPIRGRITQVTKRPGETAAPDIPVIAMVHAQVDRVVACLSEYDALAVHDGDGAVLRPRGSGADGAIGGRVISLSPSVGELPLRCQTSMLRRARGRNVVILLDEAVETLPGQLFDVRFIGSRAEDRAVAVAAERDETAKLLEVPEKLVRRSRFEPSGVLWQPELLRYLVVSDDTGFESEREHVPWLFTMDVGGRVDPDPLAVTGVEELNDVESLASDADGSVYLLASQSYSKSGNRKPSRTAFLRVDARGRAYTVTGELHIAESLDAAAASLRSRLGLEGGTRDLEIEGLAIRAGAAYFGVKAPLDATGNAMIWRLPDVSDAFDAGRFDAERLEVWARVPLRAQANDAEVAGGIADLLFLPDGTLLIATTPTSGGASSESGSIVHIAEPRPGLLAPRRVHSFAGIRPEGLSIAPAPGRFLVVFDGGKAQPSWIDLPWPG